MPDARSWLGGLALLAVAAGPMQAQAQAQAQANAETQAPTQAQTPNPLPQLSTGVLAALCGATGTDADSMTAVGYCRGFIVGVGQYHIEITRPGGIMPAFCLPQQAPTLDFVQTSFVAWVAAHPDQADTKAVDGLMRWAASTYPCAAPATRRRSGTR